MPTGPDNPPTASRPAVRATAVLTVAVLAAGAVVRADDIRTADQVLDHVTITGYENGLIAYRDADGVFDHVEIWRVDSLSVASAQRVARLNEAEQLVQSGKPAKAVILYRQALRAGHEYWPALIQARLMRAADRSGQYETSAKTFLDILGRDSVTAAHLFPQSLAHQPSRGVNRTLKRIRRFTSNQSDHGKQLLATMLRYAMLRAVADPEWTGLTKQIATAVVPPRLITPRTAPVQLSAMRSLLESGSRVEVLGAINRSLSTAPRDYLAPLLLLKSEALYLSAASPDDYLGAAIPAMRAAIYFADTPDAARGLLLAAKAHQACGHTDDAIRLLREVLRRDAATDQTRQSARRELKRLSNEKQTTG